MAKCLETVRELLIKYHPDTLVDLCTPQLRVIKPNSEMREQNDMILDCHPSSWK